MTALAWIVGVWFREAHDNLFVLATSFYYAYSSIAYLDPVMHLDVLVGCIEMQPG